MVNVCYPKTEYDGELNIGSHVDPRPEMATRRDDDPREGMGAVVALALVGLGILVGALWRELISLIVAVIR